MELDFTNNQPTPSARMPSQPNQPVVPTNQAPPAPPPPPNPPTVPTNVLPPLPPQPLPTEEPPRPNKALILILLIGLILVAGGVGGYLFLRNRSSDSGTDGLVGTGTNGTITTVDPIVLNRDAQRKSDLLTIQTYLDAYFSENKSYPVAHQFQRFDDLASTAYTSLAPKYASTLPTEPLEGSGYWYGYRSVDGLSYEVTAQLENKEDLDGAYDTEGNFLYTLTPSATSSTTNTSGLTTFEG